MKNIYVILIPSLIICLVVSSCIEPRKALEKGNYRQAFRLANRKIKYNKNVDENIEVLKISAGLMVENSLVENKKLVQSNKTKNLVKVQNKYYNMLATIGKVNIKNIGLLTEQYDVLCTAKKELDFKIADNFYQAGYTFLDRFYENWQKVQARRAYRQFKDCRKYDGDLFFKNISDLLKESHQRGIVYYIGDNYEDSFFFKKLPYNSNEEPDCDIEISQGRTEFFENSISSTQHYSKRIQIGTETEKDTSGHVTLIPIYETVTATVTTTTITETTRVYTIVDVKDLSGQCTLSSHDYYNDRLNCYTEESTNGDSRAL